MNSKESAPAWSQWTAPELADLEVRLLVEGVYQRYGYDFRNYAPQFLRRRILQFQHREGATSVSGLQERVLHNQACLERFVGSIPVSTTFLFRDPGFYAAFRKQVVPLLKTYPFYRIWVAGCATGEEVFSLAILLREEGIYEKGRIYGTDMNNEMLEKAGFGEVPATSVERSQANFARSGGRGELAAAFNFKGAKAVIDTSLRRNVIFAEHNLATDSSFNEFNVVSCRNVLIYFNRPLQDRVHKLMHESLIRFGVLGLGEKESMELTACASRYEPLDANEKIYRKIA